MGDINSLVTGPVLTTRRRAGRTMAYKSGEGMPLMSEISGTLGYLQSLLAPIKRGIKLLQWEGECQVRLVLVRKL